MNALTPESAAVSAEHKSAWGAWASIGLGAVVFVVMSVVQSIVFLVLLIVFAKKETSMARPNVLLICTDLPERLLLGP